MYKEWWKELTFVNKLYSYIGTDSFVGGSYSRKLIRYPIIPFTQSKKDWEINYVYFDVYNTNGEFSIYLSEKDKSPKIYNFGQFKDKREYRTFIINKLSILLSENKNYHIIDKEYNRFLKLNKRKQFLKSVKDG